MTHAAEAPVHRAAVPEDAPVLATRPLRAEAQMEETSRYGDDVWTLTPAWLRADRKPHQLDFTQVPHAHRDTAKLLFYALLIQDTRPAKSRSRSPASVPISPAYATSWGGHRAVSSHWRS